MLRRVKGMFGLPDGWIGDSDDDCPICKAHGIDPKKTSGPFIQNLSTSQILRCPCPMCSDARERFMDVE
jgi:hypothetical protein